jgi:hypothetical protein
VHRAVGLVEGFLRVAQDKGSARLLTRIVAFVRLRKCEPELQRGVPLHNTEHRNVLRFDERAKK